MAWRDNLRPASFRGIPFHVEDHSYEGGRRTDRNEFPFSDRNFTDDLGAKTPTYSVMAYVIGSEYDIARDALLDALETAGSGVLIHPNLGTKDVICETFSMRESQQKGGQAVFTLSFVEKGKKSFPKDSPVPFDLVSISADQMIERVKLNFIDAVVVTGVPEFIRESYATALSSAADIFETIQSTGGINQQGTQALIDQAAEWVADVADIKNPVSDLIADVEGVANRVVSIFEGIRDLSTSLDSAESSLSTAYEFETVQDTGSSALAIQNAGNQSATQDLMEQLSVANIAKTVAAKDFESYEEAIIARAETLEKIDSITLNTTDDVLYDLSRDLRAKVALAVPGVERELPRIRNIELKQSMPSLVVAYDIYESVDREGEIISRNQIRHPAFVPGGQSLNVLENG